MKTSFGIGAGPLSHTHMQTGDAPLDAQGNAGSVPAPIVTKPRYPGVLASLIIIPLGWFLLTMLTASIIRYSTGFVWEYMFLSVQLTVAGLIAYLYYLSQPARGAAEYFALQRIPWQAVIRVPLFYFSAFLLLASLAGILLKTLRTIGVSDEILARSANATAAPSFKGLLSSLVVAPLGEELIMRGLVLQGLLQRYKPIPAVLLSSVVFAVSHGHVHQGISAFLAGCVLGWVFVQTRSLWVTILMHLCHNGFVTMLRVLRTTYDSSDSVASRQSTAPTGGSDTPWELLQYYGVCLLVGGVSWLLVRSCYRSFRQEFFRDSSNGASGMVDELALALPLDAFKSRRSAPPSESG